MNPFFCRIGSKRLMASDIISNFTTHMIYVELFVGGGSIYWKKEPSMAEVINDLDTSLIDGYKLIKKTPITGFNDNLDTVEKIQKYTEIEHISIQDKLTKKIIDLCNGFGSKEIENGKVWAPSNPYLKTKNISNYKNRIHNTIILNEDYKKVINDYDTDVTFFYLDPPYEESKKLYKHSSIDYEEMANILKNIKGKFCLSINGSPYIRKVFKDFKIKEIELKTYGHSNIGNKNRTELLIMNY